MDPQLRAQLERMLQTYVDLCVQGFQDPELRKMGQAKSLVRVIRRLDALRTSHLNGQDPFDVLHVYACWDVSTVIRLLPPPNAGLRSFAAGLFGAHHKGDTFDFERSYFLACVDCCTVHENKKIAVVAAPKLPVEWCASHLGWDRERFPCLLLRAQKQKDYRYSQCVCRPDAFRYAVLQSLCPNCDKVVSSDRKRCSLCKEVVYCSEECQKEHWRSLHKRTCSFLRERAAQGEGHASLTPMLKAALAVKCYADEQP